MPHSVACLGMIKSFEEASGLELGTPVFQLQKSRIRRRLLLVPRLEKVSVTQRGPGEVVLSVVEKQPVARVDINGVPQEVGRDGAILGPAGPSSARLPWVLGADVLPSGGGTGLCLDPRVVEGLNRWLPALEASALAGFSSISFPEPGKVVVMWHETEFFLGDRRLFRDWEATGDLFHALPFIGSYLAPVLECRQSWDCHFLSTGRWRCGGHKKKQYR